jgi:type IV secretory pathway protease TraF
VEGIAVTMPDETFGRSLDRWSGGCLVAAGVLLLPNTAHPDVFDTDFARAALQTRLWVPIHASLVVSMILSLVGLLGLYARRAHLLGRLGAVGFGLAVVGMVIGACAVYWEAFLLPPVARVDPELFAWGGPMVTSWGVLSGALGGLWILGLGVLGIALSRARAVPRGAALTLAVSALAFALFAGPFVPVLDVLATVAFSVGYLWVGAALWRGATGQTERDGRPAAPPAPNAEVPAARG